MPARNVRLGREQSLVHEKGDFKYSFRAASSMRSAGSGCKSNDRTYHVYENCSGRKGAVEDEDIGDIRRLARMRKGTERECWKYISVHLRKKPCWKMNAFFAMIDLTEL